MRRCCLIDTGRAGIFSPRGVITAPSSPLEKGPRGGAFGELGGSDVPLSLLLGRFSSGVYGGFILSLHDDFIPAGSSHPSL